MIRLIRVLARLTTRWHELNSVQRDAVRNMLDLIDLGCPIDDGIADRMAARIEAAAPDVLSNGARF